MGFNNNGSKMKRATALTTATTATTAHSTKCKYANVLVYYCCIVAAIISCIAAHLPVYRRATKNYKYKLAIDSRSSGLPITPRTHTHTHTRAWHGTQFTNNTQIMNKYSHTHSDTDSDFFSFLSNHV